MSGEKGLNIKDNSELVFNGEECYSLWQTGLYYCDDLMVTIFRALEHNLKLCTKVKERIFYSFTFKYKNCKYNITLR